MGLRLREGLFWCVCEGQVLFLDVRDDRYLCLPAGAGEAFRRAASGEAGEEDEAALDLLIARGLAEPCDSHSILAPASSPLRPVGDYLEEGLGRASAGGILRALAMQVVSALRLRLRGLRRTLAGLPSPAAAAGAAPLVRTSRLEALCASFASTSLLLPAAGRCLVRAVAFQRACARLGVRSSLVFGVQMNPFRAHAWVQLGDKVLIGDFEQVRLFTPIAVFE